MTNQQIQQACSNINQIYRSNVQPQNNIQMQLPRGTTVTPINSDSELGRQLLGKIR